MQQQVTSIYYMWKLRRLTWSAPGTGPTCCWPPPLYTWGRVEEGMELVHFKCQISRENDPRILKLWHKYAIMQESSSCSLWGLRSEQTELGCISKRSSKTENVRHYLTFLSSVIIASSLHMRWTLDMDNSTKHNPKHNSQPSQILDRLRDCGESGST